MILIIAFMVISIGYPVYGITISNNNITYIDDSDRPKPEINHEILQMFLTFRERDIISENIFYKLVENEELRNSDGWRQIIEEYRESVIKDEDPFEYKEFVELVEEEAKVIELTEDIEDDFHAEKHEEYKSKKTESITTEIDLKEKPVKPDVYKKAELVTHTYETKESIVSFHIQIAASIEPCDTTYLNRLYLGDLDIHHFTEDQWNKYYVGSFSTFNEARKALSNINVKDAFIIAFSLDQKLIGYKARQVERVFSTTDLKTFHTKSSPQYRIQIAASRRPIANKELKQIYPEIDEIGIIYYDEWYKYSIEGSDTLEESRKIAERINVKGSFICRYKNGKRLPLKNIENKTAIKN